MKKILLALTLLVALGSGGFLLAHRETPEWTARSPEALAAVEAGRNASAKYYFREAKQHFERALALDPDLVAAKLGLLDVARQGVSDKEQLGRIIDELRQTDPASLNPRERLLVGYYLARIDHDRERAEKLLADYLSEHPDDPYGVEIDCGRSWSSDRVEEAEACYRRLIRLDPNRVEAQNRLGYLAMARGDFADAEEQLEIYRYLAPDQANPHDSLGELLMIIGRYDEAAAELRQAVELRPDFCASWTNLVQVALLEGDAARARGIEQEAREAQGCPEESLAANSCRIDVWSAAQEGRWQAAAESAEGCSNVFGDVAVISLRAALAAGRDQQVKALQAKYQSYSEEMGDAASRAMLDHLAAVRSLEEDDAEAAVTHFRAADENLSYRGSLGFFKLYNRLSLAAALRRLGRGEEAQQIVAAVNAVNPRFAATAFAEPAAGAPAAVTREARATP